MTTHQPAETTGHSYAVSREVDAPVGTVWAAWTESERYEKWFRAVPGSVALDVHPGGAWRAAMAGPDGGQHAMTGTYLEVVANRRLAIAMDVPSGEPSVMVLDLADLGGRTRITLSQTCATAEEHDESKAGSEILLEWCAGYVTTP